MRMTIQILVSAFESSINQVPKLLASLPSDVRILVVHQRQNPSLYSYDRLFSARNIEVLPFSERGIAVSRNRAATLATGDILVPTDSDVTFLPGAIETIRSGMSSLPDASVVTFQVQTPDGVPYKRYPQHPFRHNIRTIRRVSSIEIVVRNDAFTHQGLRWDTRFGINARYPGGLEQAFMANVLDHQLEAHYYPRPIVVHPRNSTGHQHSAQSAFFRGAVYARMYGPAAYLLLLPFAIRNAWRTGSPGEAGRYAVNLYRGARDFRTNSATPPQTT